MRKSRRLWFASCRHLRHSLAYNCLANKGDRRRCRWDDEAENGNKETHSVSINRILSRLLFVAPFSVLSGRRKGNTTRTMWVTIISGRGDRFDLEWRRVRGPESGPWNDDKSHAMDVDYLLGQARSPEAIVVQSRIKIYMQSRIAGAGWWTKVKYNVIQWLLGPPQDSQIMSSDQMDRDNRHIIWFLN